MAKALPSAVRPSTSGTSSNMAVDSRCPTISLLRSAGYQKSQRKPRSVSGAASRAGALFACKMVRTASLMASANRSILRGMVSIVLARTNRVLMTETFSAVSVLIGVG